MFDPQKVWNSPQLPTLPNVAVKLIELSRDPETEISDIIDLVKTDPAICGKILKSTNSSFFGFSSQITSIDRAVPLLGTTVVTSLALSFSLASDSVNTGPLQEFYKNYWKQSIIHAVAGETLGKQCSKGLECEFFLAGMLMDIGRLALLKAAPRDYFPALMTAEAQKRELQDTEKEFLDLDHSVVSYKLMESWGLPEALMKGVELQHASEETLIKELSPKTDELAAAMVLSNAVGDYFLSHCPGLALKRVRFVAETFFNMDSDSVDLFLQNLNERIEQAGEVFNVDMSDIGDPGDLMAQASQQLLQLTMKSQLEQQQITEKQKKTEEEVAKLETKNEELQRQATRDPLTGVYNRTFFDDASANAIEISCNRCQSFGIIFIDIDKFKSLNDTYGHQFGDEVLKRVASVIAKNLRSTDILARFGGEEFVVLVNTPTEKGIAKLGERLRSKLEDYPFDFEGKPITVTASFGAAIALPKRTDTLAAEQVLQQADEAMYDSKKNGRNQVHLRNLITEEDRKLVKAINQYKLSRWLVNKEIMDIPALSKTLLQVTPDKRRLGEMATELGLLNEVSVQEIIETQKENNERFGTIAVQLGHLSYEQLVQLLAWQAEPPSKLISTITKQGYFSIEKGRLLIGEYYESTSINKTCKLV